MPIWFPKVKPVDINNVVYHDSRFLICDILADGKTPMNLVMSFIRSKMAMTPAEASITGSETYKPAFIK